MRIAFFGQQGAFSYNRIGGVDSIARRWGLELIRRGAEVDFVHFGGGTVRTVTNPGGLTQRYCATFEGGLAALTGGYDHVVTFYVPARKRLAYGCFRRRRARETQFHFLYTSWPESWLKRELLFLESRLMPYNGFLLCVSPRQQRRVSRWSNRTLLFLPPTPESYFLRPEEKDTRDPLRVVYMGRVDPGKGTPEALSLFTELERSGQFETHIYGYPWRDKPETMQLHHQLLEQDLVPYQPSRCDRYSAAVEGQVRRILRQADVLYLPYRRLSSTVDTPLLLLEGMAHLCAVVTRPLGDLGQIYGTDRWMLDDVTDLDRARSKLQELKQQLPQERSRLASHNQEMRFDVRNVVDRFWQALATC